jgi:DUF1680 family protein
MKYNLSKKLTRSASMIVSMGAALAFAEDSVAIKPAIVSPLHGYEEVGHQDVNLRGGFWGARLYTHQRTTIPHVLNELEEHDHITNFDKAAKVVKGGSVKKEDAGSDKDESIRALKGDADKSKETAKVSEDAIVGHSAYDSDLHKAVEGACYILAHCDNPDLQKRVDTILDRILAAQEDDGYLISYFTAKEPGKKWADMRTGHELYNAGHFFEFAVEHYRLTGEPKALNAAKKFADHIDRAFGEGKRYEVGGHQEIELALIKLYRATGEKRYLDLCRFFIDERGHAHGTERKPFTVVPFVEPKREAGLTDEEYRKVVWRAKLNWRNGRMQDHKPLIEQTEAVGHAVRAGYIYSAMADLARFSDAPEYAKAVRLLWEDVVQHKMYLTGGVGTAQYGDEGFGDPYLLPNKTYCESCASIAQVFWQHRMNLMDGEVKYADVMELALYNSALSGMSISGNQFSYQNPLESRYGVERKKWIGLACCPTNLARFTPQVGSLFYAKADGKIFVNLYSSGEASILLNKKNKVRIFQDTSFPWDSRVKLDITMDQPAEFDLCLRVPGWAVGNPVPSDLYRYDQAQLLPISISVNGEPIDVTPEKSGYVSIRRTWKTGDVVDLNLPLAVNRVYSHEKLEENRGRVSLMRGPIVYCFEGIDNPNVDLFKVMLPKDAGFKTEYRANFLGGVTVIQTTGIDDQGKPVELTAVPYYAWVNREKTPMNIWLQEEKDVQKK